MKYKFDPTRNIKRFLHPELAKRAGEISDIWDDELLELFPDAFEEIKEPMTFDEWFREKLNWIIDNLPKNGIDDMIIKWFKECHEWTIENERLKHEPKQSFEVWWSPEERCPYGECKLFHLDCDECMGFAKSGWQACEQNRGYSQNSDKNN